MARSRRIFVLILGQPAKTFTINSMGMSSKRSFRYLASVVTLHPRPLPFSLRKRDFLISKKVYSCTFFFLEPFQISRYTRYGGAKVGWKYGEGGRISHGFREWPPEAFNQLANSTVLYPSKPLTKNSSEGRKSREGWEKSRYPSRGGFCVNAPAALLLSPRTYVAPASCSRSLLLVLLFILARVSTTD